MYNRQWISYICLSSYHTFYIKANNCAFRFSDPSLCSLLLSMLQVKYGENKLHVYDEAPGVDNVLLMLPHTGHWYCVSL